jgi:hypothetical protein
MALALHQNVFQTNDTLFCNCLTALIGFIMGAVKLSAWIVIARTEEWN